MDLAKLNPRGIKALFFLSIVAPVGILTSLRLAGVLRQPITVSQTVTLETITWEFQRPYPNQYTLIIDKLDSKCDVDGLSVVLSLAVSDYTNGSMYWEPPGDWIRFRIVINASTVDPNGFVTGVNITFRNDSRPSHVILLRTHLESANLSLSNIREEREPQAYTKAYVELSNPNHRNRIYFSEVGEWFLLDTSSDLTHQMEVACGIIYFNGTAYKEIVQPFQLNVIGR